MYDRRVFPAAGRTVWNSLPDELRYHRPVMMTVSNNLKINFKVVHYINLRFICLLTYLLTYLLGN